MSFQTKKRTCIFAALIAFAPAGHATAQEAWMVVKHEVADYARWKEVFDGALSTRRAVGELASYEMRCPDNPNMVAVWFEWDTFENAKTFARDPFLASGMAAAGVISKAEISIERIEKTERQVAMVGSGFTVDLPLRLTVTPAYQSTGIGND